MKKILLFIFLIIILYTNIVSATNYIIINDTYVSNGNPNTNYNSAPFVAEAWRNAFFTCVDESNDLFIDVLCYTYLDIPSNITGNITINFTTIDTSGFGLAYIYIITQQWDINTITWNNKPNHQVNPIGTISQSDAYCEIDCYYNISLNSSNYQYGLVIKPVEFGDFMKIYSYESSKPIIVSYIPEPASVSISCLTGWCYIGLENTTPQTLVQIGALNSNNIIQGHYNSATQKYESHRNNYNFNQNITVQQKEGYYYYFSTATDITIIPGTNPSINLVQGWNLVANYGLSARTLSTLKLSIGAEATSAKYYDKSLKTWITTDSQSVPAMESFFVYMSSSKTWTD